MVFLKVRLVDNNLDRTGRALSTLGEIQVNAEGSGWEEIEIT